MAADATRGGRLTEDLGGRLLARNSVTGARRASHDFARADSATRDAYALAALLSNFDGGRPASADVFAGQGASGSAAAHERGAAAGTAEELQRQREAEAHAISAETWADGIGDWSGGFAPRGTAALERRLAPMRPQSRAKPPSKYLVQSEAPARRRAWPQE
eukprot:518154-Prymnesium_polylepis.1